VNLVIDHLEYLLRRHDCVTVPGIGALMVRYRPARFDSRNPLVLLPPSREVVFNGALTESDGILESSVARRDGISFEVARRIVKEEAESLFHQLRTFGAIALGRLGELSYTEYDTILFSPADTSEWDFRFHGLRPLYLKNADTVVRHGRDSRDNRKEIVESGDGSESTLPLTVEPWNGEIQSQEVVQSGRRGRLARSIVGVAASLAVIVTLALFFLNPIKVDNEPLKASIVPVENVASEVRSESESVEIVTEEMADKVNDDDVVNVSASGAEAKTVMAVEEQKPAERKMSLRFDATDPYCVIVASFPEKSQAERYIVENSGRDLGVLQQDGKFRVYAATGQTYEEAASQKNLAGSDGAWICRR